jgi:hypothetical protein
LRKLNYDIYEIEIINEPTYTTGSADNNFNYDFVYHDTDSLEYNSSNHGLKLYKDGQLIKSAIVCASAGATGISDNSVIIDQNNILICCADKLYCLSLPDFKLNWVTQTDQATCFAVYKADNGLFTHGELEITRLDKKGNIIWQTGLRDIIVNVENEKDCFVLRENFIELQDFNSNIYHLDFDGNFIKETLSESQKLSDLNDKKINQKKWWKLWK